MAAKENDVNERGERELEEIIAFKALELAEQMGFSVDLTKGMEVFLSDVNERLETIDLQEMLSRFPRESCIVRASILNELKSRGVYNDD